MINQAHVHIYTMITQTCIPQEYQYGKEQAKYKSGGLEREEAGGVIDAG